MKEQDWNKEGEEPPPPERRNGPEDRRTPTHLEGILVKAFTAMVVVGLSCAAAIFGFGFVLKEIQQQRFDSLVQTCEETNRRNVRVNDQIDTAVADLPANKQTDEQKAGTAAFRLIISAAVPYTDDCHKYASERVKGYF